MKEHLLRGLITRLTRKGMRRDEVAVRVMTVKDETRRKLIGKLLTQSQRRVA